MEAGNYTADMQTGKADNFKDLFKVGKIISLEIWSRHVKADLV